MFCLLIKEPCHESVAYENDFSSTWIFFRSVEKLNQIVCNGHAERRLTLSLASDNSNSDCLKSGENDRDQIEIDFSIASDRLTKWRRSEVVQSQNYPPFISSFNLKLLSIQRVLCMFVTLVVFVCVFCSIWTPRSSYNAQYKSNISLLSPLYVKWSF